MTEEQHKPEREPQGDDVTQTPDALEPNTTTSPAEASADVPSTPDAGDSQLSADGGDGPNPTEDSPQAGSDSSDGATVRPEGGEPQGGTAPYDATLIELQPGKIVKGRVVQVADDEVMVDVGYKSEGRIPVQEIGLKSGQQPQDVLSQGDEIDVFIVKVEDAEGNVVLSKRRADARVVWERLERQQEAGEIIEAQVTERVKGGLLVDVGVRGFVPASHVARNYVENLDKFVGENMRLKIVELDRQRNNVVLSRKLLLEEEYRAAKESAFDTLEEGSIVKGVVRRLTNFGAFVDIGNGVEGLLHVSEMAWSRVRHPRDVLEEGSEIDVKVLSVNAESERISLSLKETLPDPWDAIDQRFQVGEIVEGTVTRVVDFGAFVKIVDGVEGLVHISQLADHHVAKPSDVVRPGDAVRVKVVSLDKKARRMGLSLREAQERKSESAKEQSFTDPDRDASVKLGDVFEGLSTFFETDDENKQ